jgi:hypothetical protein
MVLTYITQHKGSQYYKVEIHNNEHKAYIYRNHNGSWKALYKIDYLTIYLGRGNKKTEDGNTLVIQRSSSKYWFVGKCIFEWAMADGDKIVQFKSPIGSTGIAYPYVVGAKYTYLMGDGVYGPNSYLEAACKNPYAGYYVAKEWKKIRSRLVDGKR